MQPSLHRAHSQSSPSISNVCLSSQREHSSYRYKFVISSIKKIGPSSLNQWDIDSKMPFNNYAYRVDDDERRLPDDDDSQKNVQLNGFIRHSFRAAMNLSDDSDLPPYGRGWNPDNKERISNLQRAPRKWKYNWKHLLPCAPRSVKCELYQRL